MAVDFGAPVGCNTRLAGICPSPSCLGQVAQLVEQRTENPRVGSSILPLATIFSSAKPTIVLRNRIPAALIALCSPGLLIADGDAGVLDRIQVTAGGTAATVFDVARAVSVVDADEIAETMPQILTDALRGQPGVFVQQTTPGQGIPIIRGLKGSEVLHLVDGFRVNNAFFRNAPNQYLALIDVHTLSSVEVLRGPSSGRYGSDAMGGVVQLITDTPITGQPEPFSYRALARAGSAERTWMARASAAYSGAAHAVQLGASGLKAGDRRTGSGQKLPSAWSSQGADLGWHYQQARWQSWLDVQYSEQPATPRVDELIAGFGQQQPSSAEFEFRPNSRLFKRLRWQWQADLALFDQASLQIGRQVIRDHRRSQPLNRSRVDLESNRSRLDGVLGGFARQWGAHSFSYGFEFYRDQLQSSRRRIVDGEQTIRRPRFPDQTRQSSQSLWLADRWQAGEELSLEASARLSRFTLDLPASLDLPRTRIVETTPALDLGGIWSVTPDINLIAGQGWAVRVPNAFDAANFGPRPGNRFNVPNPELGTERLRASELGMRLRRPQLEWELFLWRSTARDRINSLETGELTDDGEVVVQSANIDSARLHGIEAMIELQPYPQWTLRQVINYTRGTLSTSAGQEPADRIPPLNGELSLRWQPSAALETWIRLGATARQDRLSARDRADPRINPEGSAGWARFGLGLRWQASETMTLRLQVDNLADRSYREHGSGVDAAGRDFWVELEIR